MQHKGCVVGDFEVKFGIPHNLYMLLSRRFYFMKLFSSILVLFMIMIVGDKSYGCEWARACSVQPVQQIVYPIYYVPAPQPQPVVTYQTVLIPVVQQRVEWVWPNYYPIQPIYIRPTIIRY
jgi:hypothetical protein